MAKRFHRPFRELRKLDLDEAKAEVEAKSEPLLRFSDVARRDGVERASSAPPRVAPPEPEPTVRAAEKDIEAHVFRVHRDRGRVEGRRDDTDEVVIPWLERQMPQARLDLHGMHAETARRALHRFLRGRQHRGDETVLVITGRGKRSTAGGVLREMTPDWLTEPRMNAVVRAFVTAPELHGGDGAWLVFVAPMLK